MDKDICTLLREIKDETGWSEPRLAEEIGVSQPTVNRILHGQDDCKRRTFQAICEVYGRLCPKNDRRKDDKPQKNSTTN